MVKIYDEDALSEYLKNDFILEGLSKYQGDKEFVSHEWLLNMEEKRLIYADVYGELLKSSGRKVLDVGGGFCGLSRELIERHDYTLLDIMAHDDHKKIGEISSENGGFWINSDWYEFDTDRNYDFVIANDLFPNVDQRLRMFVEKFKDITKNLILTITCNDKDVFYKVKRVDAQELLIVAPWGRDMTERVLQNLFNERSISLPKSKKPIFRNGRVVYKFSHTIS
ncbi:hypothetical protein CL631_02725 [bacterium]|jgi:hypothetical protein|nr:hypothetical protein [bacterium]MDP6659887.1 class I SAM-dependent methyltransferase [Candidatus Paceibacterota bacterium]|tara:strand:- start:42659 stop:43330 length:672 start_codon:yes stop_codon:yes gene_type:complete